MDVLERGFDRLEEYFLRSSKPTRIEHADPSASIPTPQKSWAHSAIESWLAFCARTYLNRNSPQIIGIAGARGKTVFKRTITSLLACSTTVRSNFLSYNTEIGLPLSVLQLESPKTFVDKALLPLRAFWRAITTTEELKYLVLEYGMKNEHDARALLQITRPDWLILTPISLALSPAEANALLPAVKLLVKEANPERILWVDDDPHLASLHLPKAGCFSAKQLAAENTLSVSEDERPVTVQVKRDLTGQSSKLSVIAASQLAQRLGFSKESISKWLSDET
jgi:UDP-N-acetylmuramyl pentapeptide synthase